MEALLRSACGRYILIDPEEVARIVARLYLSEALIVTPIRRLDPRLALVHHEVDVSAAR